MSTSADRVVQSKWVHKAKHFLQKAFFPCCVCFGSSSIIQLCLGPRYWMFIYAIPWSTYASSVPSKSSPAGMHREFPQCGEKSAVSGDE